MAVVDAKWPVMAVPDHEPELMVRVLALPELSAVVVPAPSLNPYSATSAILQNIPGGAVRDEHDRCVLLVNRKASLAVDGVATRAGDGTGVGGAVDALYKESITGEARGNGKRNGDVCASGIGKYNGIARADSVAGRFGGGSHAGVAIGPRRNTT